MTLPAAGCRLSEALALTRRPGRSRRRRAGVRKPQKRRIGIFRSVPVPPALLDTIDMVHGIRELGVTTRFVRNRTLSRTGHERGGNIA
jgi:integrase/recombinase XerD